MEPQLASDIAGFLTYGFSLGTALCWLGYGVKSFYTLSK